MMLPHETVTVRALDLQLLTAGLRGRLQHLEGIDSPTEYERGLLTAYRHVFQEDLRDLADRSGITRDMIGELA